MSSKQTSQYEIHSYDDASESKGSQMAGKDLQNLDAASNASHQASLQLPTLSSIGSVATHRFPTTAANDVSGTRLHQPHGVAVIGSSGSSLPPPQTQLSGQQHVLSFESPLPPMVQRGLGDRSIEKRKAAAQDIEALVRTMSESNNSSVVRSVIALLSKEFCTSMNPHSRKGGLMGLAATACGLTEKADVFLEQLLTPVLHCFDDPESRVRFYACESLYNITQHSRSSILKYFNEIFEGLTKLFADVDTDVKNGANLLDRLVKDIVTESESFRIDQFLPILQNYIRRTNPFIRQLIVGWITLLDSVPGISMVTYLPEFLDGLFNMLSDTNREIRQASDSALSEFLRELSASTVVEFGPIISILSQQCRSSDTLNRLTAITWINEIIRHPHAGGDMLLPYHSHVLLAILWCISDKENEIRIVAEKANRDLITVVQETTCSFELKSLLDALKAELLEKEDVSTKIAALSWIDMLMGKRKRDMNSFTESMLPVLLRTLSDQSDDVVLLDLQVLSRISLSQSNVGDKKDSPQGEAQFQLVLNAILEMFSKDKQLLETRGSLIIRKLCVLLNARSVYIRLADTLASYELPDYDDKNETSHASLKFVSTMVQTLNLILLTASEVHDLRVALSESFDRSANTSTGGDVDVFTTLFHCWCHNPVSTFSLCLLAKAYDLSFALIKVFSEMKDTPVGFLMQLDKLVFLLESPIFVHLRLQLLDIEEPHHASLLKSIYGILMCLPQGEAFRLLSERTRTIAELQQSLDIQPEKLQSKTSIVGRQGLDMSKFLERFQHVLDQHRRASKSDHISSGQIVVNARSSASIHPLSTQASKRVSDSATRNTLRQVEASTATRITVHRATQG